MAQILSGSKKLWSTLKRRYGFIGEKKLVVGFFVLVIGAIAIILWASCTVAGTTIARQRSEPVQNKYAELQKDDSGNSSSSQSSETTKTEDTKKTSSVVIYVDGAVITPGVYTLSQETPRICDAVDAAGGPSDTADISELNLAKPIKDGDKIHVPQEGEKQVPSSENAVEPSSKNSEQSLVNSLVNINVATEEELTKLPGVGKSMAQAIVKDRDKNGLFIKAEDLMRVSGIGEKKFERMKDYVCVS